MKVKKSIWLTLIVLIAACICSGAVAATDYGTFFLYQNETALPDGTWTYQNETAPPDVEETYEVAQIVIVNGGIYPTEIFIPGMYKKGDDVVYIIYPAATYQATASIDGNYYLVENNGRVYEDSKFILNVTSISDTSPVTNLRIYYPDGVGIWVDGSDYELPAEAKAGTYKVRAIFDEADFVNGTPVDLLMNQNNFTFTVVHDSGIGENLPSSLILQDGWNFISVPKALAAPANTASSLFAHIDTDGRGILVYNSSSQGWELVVTSTVIRPLTGYWIYSNGTAEIPLSYVTEPSVPAVKQLYSGWNAVGVSAHEAVTAESVFSGTSWRVALPWDLAGGGWNSVLVNGAGSSNTDEQYMTLGNGIWLYVDTDGTMIGLTA